MLHVRTALGGMVTAPHHLAASSGAAVLRDGGNAIEAAVAAAATIAVAYPHMNSIGGDGFWLIARPGEAPVAIDASGPAAAAVRVEDYRRHDLTAPPTRGGPAALTVAGAVAGWAAALEVARAWGGRQPLERLLADAVRHARDGVPVTAAAAALTSTHRDALAEVPGFAATFLEKGAAAGAELHQPDLAGTLQRLAAAGLDDFYAGDLADALATGLEAAGSPLKRADLEAYQAKRVAPLSLSIGSAEVWNLPPPSQGVTSLMILGIAARLGLPRPDGVAHVHGLVEATKRALRLRDLELGDPAAMHSDAKHWLQPTTLDAEAAAIDPAKAAPWPAPADRGDTVWLGTADREGCMVSYIQSLYFEYGSGVVVPGTGVLWQNRGAGFSLAAGPNQLRAGHRPLHTLNPALARFADGRALVYGAMGGDGQPQTQAALFSRYAWFDQDLQAAITAPRWLLGRTWGAPATTLKIERRFPAKVTDELRVLGHTVELVDPFDQRMGHAGAILRHPSGVLEGATDPRADGAVAAL